ncbi:MAG: response regulator transcription factor [Jiangellales bacterium]
MSQVLIAEDEERIASFIQKGLRGHGFATVTASDGVTALDLAQSDMVDLVILDIGLPMLDGFEVLRRLRAAGSTVPVIILTARDTIPDKLTGLGGGADDYMVKPFSFDELLARIRLRLRDTTDTSQGSVLRCGGFTLDLDTRLATVDGKRVELSAREFSLATVLMRNPGHVLTREQLLDRVWGFDFDPGSNVVDVYIRYLRQKVGAARIETVRGMGYRLVEA